ncbi:TlpA disulfide reductase family protein [Bacteroides sp. 519]|uniref:TlpA disulfide reductase family protein n=1 Tax=Bacteroides sp. 519 TaxID=2302937 RepID=UPI0013D56526|nr:TlpA disulfide reductase family protein [Bacteroides sp. 519]NDV60373.1 DUF4369 domain-containing protein [Bacteroides sp. 519]
MRQISFFAFVILLLSACNTGPKFTVTGEVTGAEGKKIYLEASQIGGVVVLDSAKIKSSGTFTFKGQKPESPEFYRLRIENKIINFSVDSTETVTINAPYDKFTTAYQVEGSPNSIKIKELTLKQIKLQNDVNTLMQSAQQNRLTNPAFEDSLNALINAYKEEVKTQYIYAAPNTAAAYFALFQRINNYLLFDPLNNKDDIKSFAAVATSLENFYPHAERSKNLYNLVIKGMRNTRTPRETSAANTQEFEINTTGLIDIQLKDIKGNTRKLTDLAGKVILLDFTVYQHPVSPEHNFMLRDLYDKYSDKGLEIYQISFDADEHFWKTAAHNLPWICVRDPQGVYSSQLSLYNVQQLPTYFLINKQNELFKRGEDVKDLDATVKSLL